MFNAALASQFLLCLTEVITSCTLRIAIFSTLSSNEAWNFSTPGDFEILLHSTYAESTAARLFGVSGSACFSFLIDLK